MPFTKSPQKFNAAIRTVEVGSGDKKIVLGGESVLPFYTFDGPIENAPKVGVEISDHGLEGYSEGLVKYYEGATSAVSYTHLDVYKRQGDDDFVHDVIIPSCYYCASCGGLFFLRSIRTVQRMNMAICMHTPTKNTLCVVALGKIFFKTNV